MKNIIRISIIAFIIYFAFVFINQQKMLDSYATETNQYNNQIAEAKETQNRLTETLSNINSTNYIEQMAREKLDMYLPNERVYVDMSK
jgi:cell division protein FtsB